MTDTNTTNNTQSLNSSSQEGSPSPNSHNPVSAQLINNTQYDSADKVESSSFHSSTKKSADKVDSESKMSYLQVAELAGKVNSSSFHSSTEESAVEVGSSSKHRSPCEKRRHETRKKNAIEKAAKRI